MKNSIKIEGTKKTASFFEKVLAEKRERKEEVRRKIKNGELIIVN